MKIKYFFVAVMFVMISAARVSAQEVSSKGFYFNFSGGYSFSAGTSSGAGGLVPTHNTTSVSNSDYYSRFGNVTQDESSGSSTKSNAKISLGQGIDVNVGIGYMFNSNIGFELNGDYLTGIGNTVESTSNSRQYRNVAVSVGNNNARATITQSSTSNSTTYKLTRSSLSLTPALKLVAPLGVKSAVYSRIGIVLPVSDHLNYEYSSSQSQSSSSSDTYNSSAAYNYNNSSFSSEIQKKEFESYFKVGYMAALGFNYFLSKNMAIFGEISSITHSFEVKKSTVTEWNSSSSSSNGNPTNTNLLENLDTYDKVTEYQKKYTVTNDTPNPNPDDPKQDASFSLPASSIGLKVGILLKF